MNPSPVSANIWLVSVNLKACLWCCNNSQLPTAQKLCLWWGKTLLTKRVGITPSLNEKCKRTIANKSTNCKHLLACFLSESEFNWGFIRSLSCSCLWPRRRWRVWTRVTARGPVTWREWPTERSRPGPMAARTARVLWVWRNTYRLHEDNFFI